MMTNADSPSSTLTKREFAAITVLQGFVSNPAYNSEQIQAWLQMSGQTLVSLAVASADTLLKQLDVKDKK